MCDLVGIGFLASKCKSLRVSKGDTRNVYISPLLTRRLLQGTAFALFCEKFHNIYS